MSESTIDRAWLSEAKQDIAQWSASMPKNADDRLIDWRWVESLDLEHGIGKACRRNVNLLAIFHAFTASDSSADRASDSFEASEAASQLPPAKLHDLLRDDLSIRDELESIITQCNTVFMKDFDRLIASYRLPRALAYANRRLCDEIALLRQIGVRMGLWTIAEERKGRLTVPVLRPSEGVRVDDIQDRAADIAAERAARRKSQNSQKRASDYAMSRANLSGVTSPGGSTVFDHNAAFGGAGDRGSSDLERRLADYRKPDWRDSYLPGRDVDAVMGIDIETTGIDPARVYIIDVGFEFMNMASPRPSDDQSDYRYEQDYYAAGDAYGQARLSFGVPAQNAVLGNQLILDLTGIDVRSRADVALPVRDESSSSEDSQPTSVADGDDCDCGDCDCGDAASPAYRLFDEWPEAQLGLLQRLQQQPYVAHNARFEHGFFMLNVAGYAESYRAGNITIIDTMPMSKRWDEGSIPDEGHPYGQNSLEAYAKRQGALDESKAERHLGLEDAHIMLVSMKSHLSKLQQEGRGPWGPDGRSGVGGKRCGRRW